MSVCVVEADDVDAVVSSSVEFFPLPLFDGSFVTSSCVSKFAIFALTLLFLRLLPAFDVPLVTSSEILSSVFFGALLSCLQRSYMYNESV